MRIVEGLWGWVGILSFFCFVFHLVETGVIIFQFEEVSESNFAGYKRIVVCDVCKRSNCAVLEFDIHTHAELFEVVACFCEV